MTKQQTLILCAGQQGRFDAPFLKQLAPIKGKPLLRHTIDRLPEAPIIVTIHQELVDLCENGYATLYRPTKYDKTVRTLLNTRLLWEPGQQQIVLLGDVWYSDKLLQMVYGYSGPLRMWGNRMEIFALSFVKHPAIVKALQSACQTDRGKIWEFYRIYNGIPHDQHIFDKQGCYHDIFDESDDIDTYAQYEKLLKDLQAKR